PGPYRRAHTELALYDLRRDPGEEYDVQELYPDIVNELQQIAGNARQDLGDALTEREGANRRDCGRVK
ncbi:MAG: arylsulfatase, partial [Saprospiraceae bacterium]